MTSANKNIVRKQKEQAMTNRLKIETFLDPESRIFFQNLLSIEKHGFL